MIPDPVEMPVELGFSSKVFQIGRYQQNSPGSAGFIQTIERASPLWFAEFSSVPLNDDRYMPSIAWLMGLEDALNPFLAWDPRRPMPMAYKNQSVFTDPWTQAGKTAPRITDADYANSQLTLADLEEGAIISPTDYISSKIGPAWYLFRCQEPAPVVVGPGHTATLLVKPRPNILGFGTNLVVNGDGSTTTGWSTSNSSLNAGTVLQITNSIAAFGFAYQEITGLSPGATYSVTADVTTTTSPDVTVSIDESIGSLIAGQFQTRSGVGPIAFDFEATSSAMTLALWVGDNAAGHYTEFDNISLVPSSLVRYRKACCEMKMIGGYKEDDSVDGLPKVSFKAFQFVRRA